MLAITRIAETVGGMLAQQLERPDLSGVLEQLVQAGIRSESFSQPMSGGNADMLSPYGFDATTGHPGPRTAPASAE